MLFRRLDSEGIPYDYISLYEEGKTDSDLYAKYKIKSTPVLIVIDNDEVSDRLSSINEIVDYLKNAQNTEIPIRPEEQTLLE
jgi:hypothetical protein